MRHVFFRLAIVLIGALCLLIAHPARGADGPPTQTWTPVKVVKHGLGRYASKSVVWRRADGALKESSKFDEVRVVIPGGYYSGHLTTGSVDAYIKTATDAGMPIAFIGVAYGHFDDGQYVRERVLWDGAESAPFERIDIAPLELSFDNPYGNVHWPFVDGVPYLVGNALEQRELVIGTRAQNAAWAYLIGVVHGQAVYMDSQDTVYLWGNGKIGRWTVHWGGKSYTQDIIAPDPLVCDDGLHVAAESHDGKFFLVRWGTKGPIESEIPESEWIAAGRTCDAQPDPAWDALTLQQKIDVIAHELHPDAP